MNVPHFRKTPIALAVALALSRNPYVHATPGDFVSDEFRVNRTTAGDQRNSNVAVDAQGNALIVWVSWAHHPYIDADIYGQRFRADGTRVGPEFRINSTQAGNQEQPVVAMDADGDFVVAWQRFDTDSADLFARRFTKDGTPLGNDFQVNSNTAGAVYTNTKSIASNAWGDFIVAWTDRRYFGPGTVRAKRFSRDGTPLPVPDQPGVTEFLVDTSERENVRVTVAMDADGDHVIVWSSCHDCFDGYSSIFARLYNRSNRPASGEILVRQAEPDYPGDCPEEPGPLDVAMDADGDFVVATELRCEDGYRFEGHLFHRSGQLIKKFSSHANDQPKVSMDADGDFVVQGSRFFDDSYGIPRFPVIEFFDSSANRINSIDLDRGDLYSIDPFEAVAMDADGDVIITGREQGERYSGRDSDIFARRLRGFEKIDLDLTKTDLKDPVPRGGVIDYRLRVGNLHPRGNPTGFPAIDLAIGAASGLRLTDTLPPGTRLISAQGGGWKCKIESPDLNCTRSTVLRPGAASTLNLKLRAPSSGSQVTNNASVQGDQDDPDAFNNSDLEPTSLTRP